MIDHIQESDVLVPKTYVKDVYSQNMVKAKRPGQGHAPMGLLDRPSSALAAPEAIPGPFYQIMLDPTSPEDPA